jgi:carboxypeptidase Taq
MTDNPTPYRSIEGRFTRLATIHDALGILDWDSQTMMPAGAADGRAAQIATLRVLAHELLTAPELAGALAAAEAEPDLSPWQRANLREMRHAWVHANAVPADLVEASSRAASACEMIWRTARPASDYRALLPALTEVLTLQREIGAAKAAVLGCSPYEALLDAYEPGARTATLDPLFDSLAAFLPDFLPRVLERQASLPPPRALGGPFPLAAQRALGERLMRVVGFDFNRGRVDVSLHPFCGGATNDVRLTTRYEDGDFTVSLMGILHETGHALYEQGRPAAWLTQPVGAARGMAVHESQSLIIEMQAARSRPFLDFLAPLLRETFGGNGPAWDAENLWRHYTRVEPGFIRVNADEVTYPAHVILRYRLERAMISGDLALTDLPAAWNDGLRALLGITPPDDRRGCLQDIHWPSGGWGYFPTYTLGAAIAAQLFDAASRADPGVLPGLGRGDFVPLVAWLRTHVHAKGSLLGTDDLLTAATGRPLDAALYRRHLEHRYLDGE